MSIRDLVVTGTIFALLPLCLARPWIGVLVWSWIAYMSPHRLTWGFAYNTPFAMMVALATLTGLLFTKERKSLPRAAEVYLLLALWGLFLVTSLSAIHPDRAWDQLIKVSKILLITFVTLLLCQDAKKLRWLLVVIALSIGFFGLKGGIWALSANPGNQVLGPPDTFLEGNTEIGLALNMVLPLLLLLSRDEPRRWLRYLLRATFVFTIPAVLLTYSRGAALGLAVVLPLLFLKSRLRFLILPLALLALLFGKSVMPDQWFQRMETIETYEEDRSANMRLNSWKVAYRLALDRPLLGGGFRPFSKETYLRYSPEEFLNEQQDAHSIYFQVLAEHGFTGLALYLALILSTLVTLRRVIRRSRAHPDLAWLGNAAQGVEVGLIGYLVSGAFLSMSYFDLFYSLIAIAVLLKVLVMREIAEPVWKPAPTPTALVPARAVSRGR
jgi:probable O-glycosylation ligase (exosortase A-associated)